MKSLNRRIMSALCLGALGAGLMSAPAYAGGLKQTMKEMRQAYRGAIGSSSMAELAQYTAIMKDRSMAASRMTMDRSSTDQAMYRQGMQHLQSGFGELDQAISSGNLDNAKAILKKLNNLGKDYHNRLGV